MKLKGLRIYTPAIRLDGRLTVGPRAAEEIKNRLNIPGEFRGTFHRRNNIGKSSDELAALWNQEHPDDPMV